MAFSKKLLLFTIFAVCSVIRGQEAPTVNIKDGEIGGETLKSIKGREFTAFTGIPYAKPPIGNLRFEAPEPAEPWEGTLQTSTKKNASICPQASFLTNEIIGDENCLFINVYKPKVDKANFSLPVMVFIHGGGFFAGSGTFQEYGPHRFMDRDVVLVTFNYRLGALGFLATSDEELPGNYGLLDQIAALKWVQENIQAFGGDKSKVTIFGESAGASAVTALLVSPLAKGLFHGAIAQSGSATCNWGVNFHPTSCTKYLAIKLNCTTFPITAMKECFKNLTWKQLTKESKEFDILYGFPIIFKPSVDKKVIPDDPTKLFQEGKVNAVPVIIGITKDEGAGIFTSLRKYYPRIGEDFVKEDLPDILKLLNDMSLTPKMDEIVEMIKKTYLKDVDLNNKTEFSQAMTKIYGDSLFACTQRTARHLANSTGQPTYVYIFSHRGKHAMAEEEPGEDLGVSHAADLQYLFTSEHHQMGNLTGNDEKMADNFLSLWSNFATLQNPTPDDAEGGVKMPFVWPDFQSDNKCIDLNLSPKVTGKCESQYTDIWVEEIPKLIRKTT